MMNMQIIYDHQIFTMQKWGGISRYFCELSRELNLIDNVKAKIFAGLPEHGGLLHEQVINGLEQVQGLFVPKIHRSMKARRLLGSLALPLSTLATPVDIYHPTYFYGGLSPLVRSKAKVVTVYDMINELFDSQPDQKIIQKLKYKVVSSSDRIICISKKTALDLVNIFQIDPSRIDVTYLATRILATPGKGHKRNRPFLLYVGQRSGYKNFSVLKNAYENTPAIYKDFDLVIFGGEKINDLDIPLKGKLIQIFGDDSTLRDLFEEATAFIYPSLYEGFGLPPLESMTLGCPVITTQCGSIPEVTGDSACYFDPTSPDSLVNAIYSVAGNQDLRNYMINRGQLLSKEFSWARCALETKNSYSKALNGVCNKL